MFVNQDMLWSFHSKFGTDCCNCWWTIRKFYANKAMNTFFLEKTSPSPTLPFCMKTWRHVDEAYSSRISIEYSFRRNLRWFLKIWTVVAQVDKICFRILWTWSNWQICLGWYCNPQLLQPRFSTIFRTSRLLLFYNDIITKNFSAIYAKEKSVGNPLLIHFLEIIM
jgi:hypothetical protein